MDTGDGGSVSGTIILSLVISNRVLAPSKCLDHSGPDASKNSYTQRIAVAATSSSESVVGRGVDLTMCRVVGDASSGKQDVGGLEEPVRACRSRDTAIS